VTLPPGPRGRYPGDMFLQFRQSPLSVLKDAVAEHGDVVGFRLGRQPFVYLNHPDDIKEVLVTNQKNFLKGRALERARMFLGKGLLTSEGDFHLRQRRLAQPAFHRERIASYATSIVEYSLRMRLQWKDGAEFDVHEAMMALTLGIVGKTLFDADVDGESGAIGEALEDVLQSFSYTMLPFINVLRHLPLPAMRRFKRGTKRLDETIYRIIADRRRSGEDRGDLLSMLLAAQDAEGDGTGMTDTQVRDESMTIFIAGHETTANALTWAWYLLSKNRDAESRLHAEVDALDHDPTFADLRKLEYTRRVVAESMRLFPPAYMLGRRAKATFTVGEHTLPARTIVLVSQYLQHRDARWYTDPETFDPDRWSPEAVAARPKFSYFPFGAGTRICIGEQFAWTEATLVIATLARRWRLWLSPKQRIAVQPRITLRPRYGMRMVATER
jgi:cytochrome P450